MDFIWFSLRILFSLVVLVLVFGLVFNLLLAWAWGQALEKSAELSEILSTAAIEWGGMTTLAASHLRPVGNFYEAPPLKDIKISREFKRQFPVIFVPSLHTGRGLFGFLMWRLQKNFFTSLWPFSWRAFLTSDVLLEDQLRLFVQLVLKKTESDTFRIVSFGSSYPILQRLLSSEPFKTQCDRWIAISSPEKLSASYRFLMSSRIKQSYAHESEGTESANRRVPDLLIVGTHDTLCYPAEKVWPKTKTVTISPLGHYGTLLHSLCVQKTIEELSE